MNAKRVLLAADSPRARKAISSVLERDSEFTVVGQAEDAYQALALTRELKPNLVLMSIKTLRCDLTLVTRLIRREFPHVIVVILTASDDARDFFEAIKSGAQGYLPKSLEPEDWLEYCRTLYRGSAMPRALAQRILDKFTPPTTLPEADLEADLTLMDRTPEVPSSVNQRHGQ